MQLNELLQQVRKRNSLINSDIERAERIEKIIHHTPSAKLREPLIQSLETIQEKINQEIDSLIDNQTKVSNYFEMLPDEERGIMNEYFIVGKTWEQIALKFNYSERKIYLLRHNAISLLEQIYISEDND